MIVTLGGWAIYFGDSRTVQVGVASNTSAFRNHVMIVRWGGGGPVQTFTQRPRHDPRGVVDAAEMIFSSIGHPCHSLCQREDPKDR